MLINELICGLPYLGFLEGQLYRRILGCKSDSKLDIKLKSNLKQVQHRIHHCIWYIENHLNTGQNINAPISHQEWLEWYENEINK